MISNIEISAVGKQFRRQWAFRNLHAHFGLNAPTALIGANGSGKSTLIQIIGGFFPPSEGKVIYSDHQRTVDIENVFKDIAFCAPYMSLIEELTLIETIELHESLKGFSVDNQDFIAWSYLDGNENKQIKYFSSGMRQRLKLALALRSKGSVLLLDEPTANLDQKGIDWYLANIRKYAQNRILIIASNIEKEYDFCEKKIFLGEIIR